MSRGCVTAARRGGLRKARLIEEHGADIALLDLRNQFARCHRARRMLDPCGAYYVALASASQLVIWNMKSHCYPPYTGYHLYYPGRRPPSAAFTTL